MKTIIYNIGTLAGILPEGTLKLEGRQMDHVECIEDAYLVIEDGVITGFGHYPAGTGVQNRATSLAAGGGARGEVVGGVVSEPMLFRHYNFAAEPGLRRAPKAEGRLPARQTSPHRLRSDADKSRRHSRSSAAPAHRPHSSAPRPLCTHPRSGSPDPRRPPLRRLVSSPDMHLSKL